ncbi:hypothetical protein AciX9_2005 [Granulicella tundricola MP5ACTX9]|uniref:Uncharacterized protein n=1 Tax=Granulicella tundricola (strain ATCC BAA-1859 / DSM 23138 / MP5ACTX9) TaxID=1198114 RepID=E8X196_GRATM|nr:hypothetical protein AciX9_2005 [Granulicella tundricola MP5ACTX9]
MKKLLFWTTVLSGTAAAYLLYKRGVPVGTIASDVLTHPIGTLVHELGAGGAAR